MACRAIWRLTASCRKLATWVLVASSASKDRRRRQSSPGLAAVSVYLARHEARPHRILRRRQHSRREQNRYQRRLRRHSPGRRQHRSWRRLVAQSRREEDLARYHRHLVQQRRARRRERGLRRRCGSVDLLRQGRLSLQSRRRFRPSSVSCPDKNNHKVNGGAEGRGSRAGLSIWRRRG